MSVWVVQSSAFQPPFIFLCLAVNLGDTMSLLRSEDLSTTCRIEHRVLSMAYQVFHDITCYTASPTPSLCPSTHCKLSCLAGKEDFILVLSSAWNTVSFSICTLFFVLYNRTQLLLVFPLCVILCKTATLQLSLFCPLSYSSQHSLPPDCTCHAFHTMYADDTDDILPFVYCSCVMFSY